MSEIMLHTKLRELEDELKVEREMRTKHEKDVSNLRLDIADLDVQLQESNSARDREIEASKRLRQEIADLKQKIDHQHHDNEEALLLFKRKHQEQFNELTTHIDNLSKTKYKFEKENKSYQIQMDELRKENESLARAKSNALSTIRDLESKQIESLQRIEELIRQLNEFNELKSKLTKENSEYFRRNSSIEFEMQQLSLNNKRLNQEFDDARLQLENETLVKNSLESKVKSIQLDLDNASLQLEEEAEARLELQKQLAKLQDEFKSNKDKVEKEAQLRIDEVDDSKRRLNNRYIEIQEQLTDTLVKFSNIEKAKLKLQSQHEVLLDDYEKTKKRADDATKHEKALEKEAEELRFKLNEANLEVETLYTTNKNYATEISKYRHANEVLNEQLEVTQKERRKLTDEVEATNTQLLEHQGKLNDIERKIKTIDMDRAQLQNDLDDSRDQLQLEASKNQSLQSQYEKLKTEADKKLIDKENEIDSLRASTRRQLEAMQSQLEDGELRNKSDLNSLKKKFQAEIEDIRSRLESAKKAKTDAESQQKKLLQTNKELIDKLTEEQNLYDITCDQLISTEKKASSFKAELEEIKTLYDKVEKSKKALDLEFHDMEEKLNEMQAAYNKAITEKKKFEADAIAASDELHEAKYELKNAEEKIRSVNASLLKREEELKQEKEINHELENSRKSLEQQLKDIQTRVEDAEEYARRETKRINSKLESRICQLEGELDFERAKEQELIKELRRLEKRNKDLVEQVAEEQNKLFAITDAYDKQQEKMKKYKGQIEGAEEQIAVNISKCKKLQRELEDAEDRAEQIAKNFLRASSVNRTTDNINNNNIYDSDYGDSDQYSSPNEATINSQSSSLAKTPFYLRSSHYLYPKSNNDDHQPSKASHGGGSWRSKYCKTVDIDDDDIQVTPRHSSRYSTSSFAYQAIRNKPWSFSTNSSSPYNRGDRARSVAHMYESDTQYNNPNPRAYGNSRNSVSRFYDDEQTVTTSKTASLSASHRLNAIKSYDAKQQERLSSIYKSLNGKSVNSSSTAKNKAQSPELDATDSSTSRVSASISSGAVNDIKLALNNNETTVNTINDNNMSNSKRSVEIEKGILLASETSVTPTPENLD